MNKQLIKKIISNKSNLKFTFNSRMHFFTQLILILILSISLLSPLGRFIDIKFTYTTFASALIDKKGRVIEEIKSPTIESTIDPDTISDAIRFVPSSDIDYSNRKYEGPSKNIYSNGILYAETTESNTKNDYATIRHTASITEIDNDRCEFYEDITKDRLRLKIFESGLGEIRAKDGFYKVNGKTFYFDIEGLMVLGPAYDDIGNYYFFSYETGELVEEKQVR